MPKRAPARSPCTGTARRFCPLTDCRGGFTALHLRCGRRCARSDDAAVLRLRRRRHRPVRRPGFGHADDRSGDRDGGRKHRLLRHRDGGYPHGELRAAGRRLCRHVLARSGQRERRQRLGRLAFHGRQCGHPVPGAGPDPDPDLHGVRHRRSRRHRRRRTSPSRSTAPTTRRPRSTIRSSPMSAPSGTVVIPAWALAANDTDPDTTDTSAVEQHRHQHGRQRGFAFGDAFFTDDATLGGSFTYDVTDGIATSATRPPRPSSTMPTTTTTLTGTGGDDILDRQQRQRETLNGGGGNDILIGNDGSSRLTGGTGNDIFAFLQPPTVTNIDHGLQQHDRARPHRGLGERLRRRADRRHGRTSGVRDLRRRPVLRVRRGIPLRHRERRRSTSAPTARTASAIALVQVQAGVTINPHDLLIV